MSRSNCANVGPSSKRSGLTLLELIVALGILAALATMAIQSMEPLADQTRYESTQRLLDQLREATIGGFGARNADGSPLVSGFLADTGTLPTSLDDFTTQPLSLIAYTLQSFDSDRDSVNDISLSSGWNGPYLLLGAGKTEIVDGWGRAPLVDPDAGIYDFRSQGSDGDSVNPETGYQADVSVLMPATRYAAAAVFRLFAIDGTTGTRINPTVTGTEQLGVMLYSVNGNGGTTGAIEEVMLPVDAAGNFEVTRSNFLQGRAAVRAFLWDDLNSDDELDVGEPITNSSYVHYFTVMGGVDLRIELELR